MQKLPIFLSLFVFIACNSSNSNNYNSSPTSSSPESFPDLMNNGIIVEYKSAEFSSEIVEEKFKSE